MSRTHRTSWNFASNLLFTAVTLVGGLLAMPLLIRWLGEERLGAVRAASDWTGYLGLFELGLGGALAPLLARAASSGDPAQVRLTLGVGIRRYKRIVVSMLAAGIVMALFITRLIPVSAALRTELNIGFCISLISIFFSILSPFRALTDASQRGYIISLLCSLQSVVVTGLTLVLAYLIWGIVGQFVALVVGSAVFWVFLMRDVLKRYPGALKLIFASPRNEQLNKDISKLSWPTFILNVSGRVGLFTDNILIAYFMGPAAVVSFVVTQRLATMAQAQMQSIGNSSWAALAELHVKNEYESFRKRLVELTVLVAALAVATLAPIAAYNHFFVQIWVGESHFAGNWVTLLAVFNGFIQSTLSLWGWVFSGTGKVAKLVPVATASCTVNIIVSVAATWLFGFPGPLIGTSVALSCISFTAFVILLHREFSVSIGGLLRGPGFALATGIPYALALWWIAHHHQPPGWNDQRFHHIFRWAGIGCEMSAAAIVYLVFAWFVLLSPTDRSVWSHRMKMIFTRRAGT